MKQRKMRVKKKPVVSVREWRPRPQLMVMAELLVNPEDRRPKIEKIREAGLTEQAFYRWMKDERYLKYIECLLEKYTNSELPGIWRALIRKCMMGDTASLKLYFDVKGMTAEHRLRREMLQYKKQYDAKMIELKEKELEIKDW